MSLNASLSIAVQSLNAASGALQATNNNKTRAAEMLGISLKTLHNKLKEYGRPQDAVLAEEG